MMFDKTMAAPTFASDWLQPQFVPQQEAIFY